MHFKVLTSLDQSLQIMSTYQSFRIMALAGGNALVRDSRGWEWASGRHLFFSENHF